MSNEYTNLRDNNTNMIYKILVIFKLISKTRKWTRMHVDIICWGIVIIVVIICFK